MIPYKLDSMVITKKELADYLPPEEIQEIIDVFIDEKAMYTFSELLNQLIPVDFVQWATVYLPLTPQDIESANNFLENKNSLQYRSSNVKDSKYVDYSDAVENSEYISLSSNVKNSSYVYDSMNIENSHNINDCTDVINSTCIKSSNSIHNSKIVYKSGAVDNSQVIFHSFNIEDCYLIYGGKNLVDCFLCDNITDRKHFLLCTESIDADYAILNQPVSEKTFKTGAAALILFLRKECHIDIDLYRGHSFMYYPNMTRDIFNNDKAAYWLKNQVIPKELRTQTNLYLAYKLTMCDKLIQR